MIEQWHVFQNISHPIPYYIGKNAQDNKDMILKSNDDDIWFHAYDQSSCHIVVKLPDVCFSKKQLNTIIKRGAQLCKQNTNSLKTCENIKVTYCYVGKLQVDEYQVGSVHINGNSKTIII